jgi:hypothetical protein
MQNHPKPDLKLILRPKEDFRDIFQPGPCNQRLNVYTNARASIFLECSAFNCNHVLNALGLGA